MQFGLKSPCDKCPFRNDITPFIRAARAAEICHTIIERQGTFACHKTVEYDDEGNTREGKKTQHCAGAMIMLEHMERPNQMMRICERVGHYDHTKMDMAAPVFKSDKEMIKHIKKGNK